MKLSIHADRTERLAGIRAEDIHKWIDGFFDAGSFAHFLRTGSRDGFNPYSHRKYRHCAEALKDAYREFEGTYSREQIKAVFECHIQDDYDGFIPLQEDFENGTFAEKYHEADEPPGRERILSEAELTEYFKGKADYARVAAGSRKLSARFYWRIVWPTVFAAVLFASSSFTVIVPVFRSGMMKQKKELIRELTSTAASLIEFYVRQEEAGVLSREAAQRQAAAEVAGLRYGTSRKDYFWITDMHPRMVMHPYRPELVGHDLTDYTDHEDKSGKRLFIESVERVRADGEGYLEYLWQWMDDPKRAEPKLSYVRGVPEWGWVLGTGIYIHDVEQEIARLSRNLLVADGILATLLLALLANIVFQSRRIELDRTRAEAGLREAKNRYRALVEGSSEGYLLEVGGETVYSNHTLQRMTGYDEAELAAMKAWELLEPDAEVNVFAGEHLRSVYGHTAASAEFEARIRTRHGEPLDVLISTSRIFFSDKNGHVVSFSEISRGRQHTLKAFCSSDASRQVPEPLLRQQIAEAKTAGQVIQTLKQLPELIRTMTDQGARPRVLRETIGTACDAVIQRLIAQALEEDDTLPVPFAFLSLGSNARHEMTMFSDQDNALVFADVAADRLAEVRRRFLGLADDVCGKLSKAGYPYCSGGIMAANPKWCLSLSEWKKCFAKWVLDATPESILEVNVFFDVRCAYGDEGLVAELRDHVRALTRQNPEFFMHYAKNCLGYKVPRLRWHKDSGTINLKECLKPIETFARLYALKNGVESLGTLDRLGALREAGVLQEETFREMGYVFDYLWQMRFFNQISASAELSTETDGLDIGRLTELERTNLQSVLARIPIFQSKLSYDFLGMQV
jgi:PAS domain S-box-containing protein